MTAQPELEYRSYRGAEIEQVLIPLGELRIAVFRDYPYLYEGDLAYEMEYLRTYSQAVGSFLHTAWDGDRLIGATTCIPLQSETEEVQKPFRDAGIALETVCYFGESILLSAYRGRGIGHRFFAEREAHASALGCTLSAFCAVDRPADHPLRPADYRPLDTFWAQRGYVKQPGMQATFTWREVGEEAESPKTLTFWLHTL